MPFFDQVFNADFFDPGYWAGGTDQPAPVGCWTILPENRGLASSPYGFSYPFVQADEALEGILADAYLAYKSSAELPFSIRWMYGFDRAVNCGVVLEEGGYSEGSSVGSEMGGSWPSPTHKVDILIVAGNEQTVFDSTAAYYYTATAFNSRYLIHEWRTTDAVCRVVQRTAVPNAALARLLPRTIVPEDGRLDARTYDLVPRRVTAFKVGSYINGAGITLETGYNVALTAVPTTRGLRNVTQITLSAVPGDGLGRAPGCNETTPLVRTLNQQPGNPATGNFILQARDCSYVRRSPLLIGEQVYRGQATVGDDCTACCSCTDYVNFQKQVLALWKQEESTATEVAALILLYQMMLDRWNAQKDCFDTHTVSMQTVAFDGDLWISSSICNPSNECLTNPAIAIAYVMPLIARLNGPIRAIAANGTGNFGATIVSHVPGGVGTGMFTGGWPLVLPHSQVSLHMHVPIASTTGRPAPMALTITGHTDSGPVPGTVTKSVRVGAPSV